MAKGVSPLRLIIRNAPRKTDGIDGSSSGLDGIGAAAPSRQPLGPITDTVRNPLTTFAEQSSGDPSTPRHKARVSSHGHEKFPHLENSEVHVASVNITPDKSASLQSKGKFTWQHRHGSTAQSITRDGVPSLNTPPRPPKASACSDGQAANNQDTLQSLSQNSRGASTGGGSVPSTPKTGRSVGGKSTTESENGGSQSQNATPSKSVSRSLKYGQQGSANNSGASGLTNFRSTVSQHGISRPLGYLQALKGVIPANQNFLEHHFELEEDASFWRDHNVQVIIRTRPISNIELASQGSNRCLKQESPHAVSWLGQPESRFTFDHVAGETIAQAKLFDVAGLPMVENCMSGYNSCMFAYGQTGSGKTHTMLGDIENLDHRPSDNRGMTPRVFEYLFSRIRMEEECRRHEHLTFFCKCSFLEIYNEQITDLLEPSSTNLQLREDVKKGVYVENLSEVEVQCVQDVIQLLLKGAASRKVAATNMNRESSRSHSVFTCVVESKWENKSMTNSRYGRLHLVDLAGSERQKSSGAEGGRLKEAANINKSLSTLGLVIMILVDVANGKQRHVPYRDSKLTFLLQDSLGGNSKTIMIANVSPSSCCAMETLSTLKFAQRAKFICNNAVINEDASGDVIALRQRIEDLKVEVDRLRRESMLRVSSSRILALENGCLAGQKCVDKFDASTVDCKVIEDSTLDSRNANMSETITITNNDKQLRSIEAVLGGALRREQQAEDITKKLAAEIEQLNRLVRQREDDSQCAKMMLKFREEKIRRLEGIADNVMSVEAFYDDERKNLIDELQVIRGRLDRNPELTRFAMENIRLMEELRRYQEFYDGGERDVLLEEISGLRSQLLDMLDAKVGEEQNIGKLLTPQKRALAPELSALERKNELLLIEVKCYQSELKECRNNLNSCLVANADLSRQVDELQAWEKELKNERSQKPNREPFVCLEEEIPHEFFSGANLPDPQAVNSFADPTTALKSLEMEALDSQHRRAMAIVEQQVLELRNQLKEAHDLIQKLSSEVQEANELSHQRKLKENVPCIVEDDAVVRQGLQDRWEKLQEVEMRHSEEMTQLQLELDSMEEVLKEERQQRLSADQKIDDLSATVSKLEQAQGVAEEVSKEERKQRLVAEETCEELRSLLSAAVSTISKLEQEQGLAEDVSKEERQQHLLAEQTREELRSQLSATVSKLEEAHCLVEALEGQQLFSLNELENLQSEHTMLLSKMKKQEEGELELQKHFKDENTQDDPALSILEKKLLRTQRGKEEARRINRQFQQEKASRMALDKERELTMSEVETQAALAITTLQSEILELRDEVSVAVESEAAAKLETSHLRNEVETLQQTVDELEDTNKYLSDKSGEYRKLVEVKQAHWESSASNLIEYLSDGDKALSEAVREMDEIKETTIHHLSQMDNKHVVEKRDTAESVCHRLQGVQFMVKETESKVRALNDAEETGATTNVLFEAGEAMIRESEKKSMVAFLMVKALTVAVEELELEQCRLVHVASETEMRCRGTEQELVATHGDLARLRSKLMEAELHEKALSGQMEELSRANTRCVLEREDAKRVIEEMREEKDRLRVDLSYVNAEAEDAEIAIFDSFRRSLQALESVEGRLTIVGEEFEGLETSQRNLENDLVLLDTAATMSSITLEEMDHKCLEMQRRVENAEVQMYEVQAAAGCALAQIVLERGKMKEENDRRETELRDQIAAAELKLVATEGSLKLAVANVEALRLSMGAFEEEILQLNEDSKTSLSKVRELHELENWRLVLAASEAQMRCREKEEELVATQGDLAEVRSKLTEAELHRTTLSGQIEELTGVKSRWEVEREDTSRLMDDMKERKDSLRFDLTVLNTELEEREKAIFDSFRRSQQALESVEARLTTVDEELGGLEKSERDLENGLALLDSPAAISSVAIDENELKYLKMQRRVQNAEVQMYEMQAVADSVIGQLDRERDQWEAEKRTMKGDNDARETEFRDQIVAAELQLAATQGDLARLRSELTEAELHEKALSELVEQLTGANTRWELEREDRKRTIEDMREEKDRFRFDLTCVNSEVEKREKATFDSFSRSQQALDNVEARLATVDQELAALEKSEQNLGNDLALLSSAATTSFLAMEENQHKYLHMQRQVQNAEVRMYQIQAAADSDMGQLVLERANWEAEKRKMKEDNDARETELRDEIAAAGVKLVATEGSLKLAVENVEALSVRIRVLEEEIHQLNEDAKTSLSKVREQEEQTELRVSEMQHCVKALTVAVEEQELEQCRLVLSASQAEMHCREKEQELFATQANLAGIRSKLMEAELREKTMSGQIEELAGAKTRLEVERGDAKRAIEEMREERDMLRIEIRDLNAQVDERETAIFDSFRRSLQVVEIVESRLITVDQELGELEKSERNLQNDLALFSVAAAISSVAMEENQHKYLELRRRVENAEVEMYEKQAAADSALTQVVMERGDREVEKTKMKDDNEARETELRDEIAAAGVKLVATEGSLKLAAETVNALSLSVRALEEEICHLNEDAKMSLSKVREQEQQTELRVSEMQHCVKALTVAVEEQELEKSRLLVSASQADMRYQEKEQELVATQADLAGIRSKLMKAELHEKTLSGQIEELTGAKIQWELEREDATRAIAEMKEEKYMLRIELTSLNTEVDESEKAIFDSFRRSLQALGSVEARLRAVDEELGGLESSQRNLDNGLAWLSSAATTSSIAMEGNEQKYLEMQRQVQNAEVQMCAMQAAADSVLAQVVLERDNWEAEKRKMKDEKDALETELRNDIGAAGVKLVATEGMLKLAVENVDALSLSVRALEEEICQLKEDAKMSVSKVTEQQGQIDTLRAVSLALKAECTAADESIAGLNELRQQYILAEASWRSEQELLKGKLDELEISSAQISREEEGKEQCGVCNSRGQLNQWVPECIPGSEDQKHFEEPREDDMEQEEIKLLRAKISEKEITILSAKKEMQIAIANLKEAEQEMDKVHRQNYNLAQIQLDNKSVIERLSLEIRTAEEELLKRDIKIEGCEGELLKVVGVMSDWETKMHDVEIEWRKEKEALAHELTEAKLVANEKRTEAGALLQKFQDGQATLKEAEDLVDALVKANENAKHDALDWKTEKDNLGIVQGWWMPERDKLVSKIARLETDMHTQKQDIWIICKEVVNGSVATIDVLLAVDNELCELKNEYQHHMDHLAVEMKTLKGDIVAFLLDLEGEMMKSFEIMQTVVNELTSARERSLRDLSDLKVLHEEGAAHSLQMINTQLSAVENNRDKYLTNVVVVNEQLEMTQTQQKTAENDRDKYETDFVVFSEQLEMTMNGQLNAVEKERDQYQSDLAVLRLQLEMAQTMNSHLTSVEKERDQYQSDLAALNVQLEKAQTLNIQLKAVEKDCDQHQTDLAVVNTQLEMAQTLAAEAHQAAERSKTHAEEKEEEARILERSVEELESTVYALESQLDIVKRESEGQQVAKEALEVELEAVKLQMGLMQVTIETQDAKTLRDFQGAETSKTELDRVVIEMTNQQIHARKSVESLQQECAEKDVQLRSCKAHIAELMLGAEKQASENQQKLRALEAMVEHLKVEERKVYPAGGSASKAAEKSTAKVKGTGSPFKCIGSGLEKQRSSEMDEELSAAKKRIKELETVAASRQKEVFMLNTKLAEAESMTHDVVRDLLGVKMDIASYATLLNQQQVQRIAERARRRTVEAQQKEDELDTLRDRLNEFIEERESWLDEINRRQADAVAARVSAEKLRLRDETLTAENDKFREDCHALRKRVADLEDEIKKLSGQQNLQQRIHHHAKIKEENNSIRLQNEDLSGKLRRMEILFTRVNDELARYRTAEGKGPFLNFDEEARLQKKLQETEENRLQLAETLIGMCTRIMQVAGIQRASRDLDPSAAMIALQRLQDRLESLEREISDYKLQARMAVEKRRLSDLRDFHTPVKAICANTNFTANQQLPSPVSSSR